MLAENATECVAILKLSIPELELSSGPTCSTLITTRSTQYYLVNGILKGVVGRACRESDHRQLEQRQSTARACASSPAAAIARSSPDITMPTICRSFQAWKSAAHDVDGVIGFMYTTWVRKFSLLEKYGEAIKAAQKSR